MACTNPVAASALSSETKHFECARSHHRTRSDTTGCQQLSGAFCLLVMKNAALDYNTIHTPHLTALCPGLPGSAGTRKVKPIWILLKQESEWQWHQLGHVQVCTSLQTDNHASTLPLSSLQARCPACRPTNSVKALKAIQYNTADLK